MERDPASQPGGRLLIVTRFPERFASFGQSAEIVGTCREALELLDRKPYVAVFCDMAQLGEQESGFRFANTLKRRDDVPPVYLMAESVTRIEQMSAQRNGAVDLVERQPEALRAVVSSGLPARAKVAAATTAAAVAAAIAPALPDPAVDHIKAGLRRYLGPAADGVVDETLASLSRRRGDKVPVDAFVHAVSQYIDDARLRERFLADILR